MNLSHFYAIVSMRWQIMRNRFRKSGTVNWVLTLILIACAVLCSLGTFIFTAGWGSFLLAKLNPFDVIFVWDALVLLFLFGWALALITELQRSEMLSLKNLLHLPISLAGAFFLNYTSSLVSLTLLFFVPAMVGLCVASVVQYGMKSLVVFALLLSFLLMVTGISYQLRGWLARLMENKRTRGTVIAISTLIFVLASQIPNMVNMGTLGSRTSPGMKRETAHAERLDKLKEQMDSGAIDREEYATELKQAEEEITKLRDDERKTNRSTFNRTATIANAALPIGWLPFGASHAARGAVVLPWMCVFGMSSIGIVSLIMAYRSTIRAYTGDHNKTYRHGTAKKSKVHAKGSILEKSVPFLTETQSVISLATLRSTVRAPEAKMALLTPLIFACVFGSMILTGEMTKLPEVVRPWLGIGVLGMSVTGMAQMMLNMFGLDRQGFRAYVLSPVPRRDILLGKNFGIFPFVFTLSSALIIFMGVMIKLQFTHIVATVLQSIVAFFIFCIVTNFTSIIAPLAMKEGTMKPVSMKLSVLLLQFLAVFFVPVTVIPAAISLAIELLLKEFGGVSGVPMYLLLTLIEVPIAVWFYCKMQDIQGKHLHDREHKILDAISKTAD